MHVVRPETSPVFDMIYLKLTDLFCSICLNVIENENHIQMVTSWYFAS